MGILEIEKMKNVYGIKNLCSNGAFSNNVVIYAPNGGMKSSFANGLLKISKGEIPKERIFGRKTEYKIKVNGVEYTENNPAVIENIVTFSFDSLKLDINSMTQKLSFLTVSPRIKELYNNDYLPVEKRINEVIEKLSKSIIEKKSKIDNIEIAFNELKEIYEVDNWHEIIEFLFAEDKKKSYETEINYIEIFNEKTTEIISDKTFVSGVKALNNIINKKISSTLFGNTFGSFDANKFGKALLETHFFEAGHALILKDKTEINNYDAYEKLLIEEEKKLYGEPEVKEVIESLVKKLEKNKETKSLKEIVKSDSSMLAELENVTELKKKIIMYKLSNMFTEIEEAKYLIDNSKSILEKIIISAKKEESYWGNIINKFHDRFDVPFKIEIINEFNSVIGSQLPMFNFLFSDTMAKSAQKVSEMQLQETLSTGQLRAMKILYFLFDVEHSINKNENTIVVLDDIVDSFDYKNKYAMIEYIKELSSYKTQIIILTHNFDFFVTCRNRLKGFEWFAVNNHDDKEIITGFSGNVSMDGLKLFKNWKEKIEQDFNKNKNLVIALIPVVRNLLDLREANGDSDYEKICEILHYRTNTESITFSDLKSSFSNQIRLNVDPIGNEKVYNYIIGTADSIHSNSNRDSIALDEKLVLAIAIRLNCEKFLASKDSSLLATNSLNESFNAIESKLTDLEKRIINSAVVTTPEFIHINAFMYEPLVDVSIMNLKKLYAETKSML